MTPVPVEAVKNINSAAAEINKYNQSMKVGETVVELDQFKYTLSTYQKPLVEVRDSL